MGKNDRIRECYEHYEAAPEVIRKHQKVLDAMESYAEAAVKDAFWKGYVCGRSDKFAEDWSTL